MQKVVKARLLETILVLKTISAMLPFDISIYYGHLSCACCLQKKKSNFRPVVLRDAISSKQMRRHREEKAGLILSMNGFIQERSAEMHMR